MLYRLYQPADFPHLYAIEEICFQPPIRFSRSHLRKLIENPGSATWVVEEAGEIGGFAIVDWSGSPGQLRAYVETIEVLPAQRGRGAGSELLRRIEDSARAANAAAIWLHVESTNTSAIRLYRAHGYQPQGSTRHYYARGRNADIYSKSLTQTP